MQDEILPRLDQFRPGLGSTNRKSRLLDPMPCDSRRARSVFDKPSQSTQSQLHDGCKSRTAHTTAAIYLEGSLPNKSGSNEGMTAAAEQSSRFLHHDSTTAPMTSAHLVTPWARWPLSCNVRARTSCRVTESGAMAGLPKRYPKRPVARQMTTVPLVGSISSILTHAVPSTLQNGDNDTTHPL